MTDDEFNDVLARAEAIDTPEHDLDLLRDRRKTSPFTMGGVKSGSREYWRRWRIANREKNKLYQKRHYHKMRRLELAAQLAAGVGTKEGREVGIQEALRLVDEEVRKIGEVRKELKETNVIEPKDQIEFVAEEAKRLGMSYDECLVYMTKKAEALNDITGEETVDLDALINSIPDEEKGE